MNTAAALSRSDVIFDSNLAALRMALPACADQVLSDSAPVTIYDATGRDGAATFSWTDDAGRQWWLGRTTMPSVSEPAIVEQFQSDGGNVLLYHMGHGTACRMLLERLAPHQAVMVVAPCAWQLALSLRLHDFSSWLGSGRLVVFGGDDPWGALRAFLLDHSGYLEPQRVVSWPWLGPEEIVQITSRLGEIQRTVGAQRAEKRAAIGHRIAVSDTTNHPAGPGAEGGATCRLAVLSNDPRAEVIDLALALTVAARGLDWPVDRLVLDGPQRAGPLAAEEALVELSPTLCILIDTPPSALAYRLPNGAKFVLWTGRDAPPAAWLGGLGPEVRVGVMSHAVADSIRTAGFDEGRVCILPPAADVRASEVPAAVGSGVAVIADGGSISAESVGLHLATHYRIWDAAVKIIEQTVDEYSDALAADIIDEAQRRLGIRLESDEVRRGLAARVAAHLGPRIVAARYLSALHEAGIEFDLYGDGWEGHPDIAVHRRGPSPRHATIMRILEESAAVVFLSTDAGVPRYMMDALCAGRIVFQLFPARTESTRTHGMLAVGFCDESSEAYSAPIDPARYVQGFGSRREFVDLLRRFREAPESFHQTADAAEHIRAGHTWAHRLQQIAALFFD